jgi:hypothetical protein
MIISISTNLKLRIVSESLAFGIWNHNNILITQQQFYQQDQVFPVPNMEACLIKSSRNKFLLFLWSMEAQVSPCFFCQNLKLEG